MTIKMIYRAGAALMFGGSLLLAYAAMFGALELGKYDEYCVDTVFEIGQTCILKRQFYIGLGLIAVFFCIIQKIIWFLFYRATYRLISLYRDAYKNQG